MCTTVPVRKETVLRAVVYHHVSLANKKKTGTCPRCIRTPEKKGENDNAFELYKTCRCAYFRFFPIPPQGILLIHTINTHLVLLINTIHAYC